MLSKLKGDFKNFKNILILIVVFVVLIIFYSSIYSKTDSKKSEIKNSLSAVEYCQSIENRLCNVLGKIKNIGSVDVFIMVDASPTIKYLEETKTETSTKEQSETSIVETEIVLSKNGSLSTPVVVVELMPKITGVLVVASGANDVRIKNTLINTISAILNINVSNVEVLEGDKWKYYFLGRVIKC